jgi:hypothetical protein
MVRTRMFRTAFFTFAVRWKPIAIRWGDMETGVSRVEPEYSYSHLMSRYD